VRKLQPKTLIIKKIAVIKESVQNLVMYEA